MSKKKYVNVGVMCSRKKENEDDPQEYYIKFDKDIKVTIDGDTVTGGYLNVSDPLDKCDKMVAKAERQLEDGTIDEEAYDQILEKADDLAKRYTEGGDLDYIRFELTYVRKG